MKSVKMKRALTDTVLLCIGCLIYAIGIGLFLDPNNLCPAGVSGLAIVANHWIEVIFGSTPLTTGAIIVIFNVPIMIFGIYKLGWRFFFSTIAVILVSSGFIDVLQYFFEPMTTEPLLASILGGASMSLGIGLVFRAGATTGGADVIVRILRTKYRHIKTNELFWIIDGIVILIFALSFKSVDIFMYALIMLAVNTCVLDMVLYGTDSAKLLYIISDKQQEISSYLLEHLETGVTLIKAKGAYTGNEKEVVMCVVRKQQLPRVRQLVCDTDPTAFMIVTKATEIFGEGYKAHDSVDM